MTLRFLLLCGLAGLLSAITVVLGIGEVAQAFYRALRALCEARNVKREV